MVSLCLSYTHTHTHTHTQTHSGFMYLGVDPFPDVDEIFFTFMHIHTDNGKVKTVNKNDIATKIHPQGPRPALGLPVKTKNTQLLSLFSAWFLHHLHPCCSLNTSCLHVFSHRILIKTLKCRCYFP